ncbi:MAG: hypothetical protein ACFFAH_00650 [Promethearchaeota archaeon]
MPSIAHLVLGGVIALCFYYISDGKFTKTHVFIFFLCNYLGPDVGWVFGIGRLTHSLLFWPLFALILAFIYHYFTRFTIKIDGIKNIEIIDLEGHKLHYLNTYLLVLAAGILHLYLDGIMNNEGTFRIIPQLPLNYEELSLTLGDLIAFGEEGVLQINFLIAIFIGVTLIFGFIFVFIWFLKKNSKTNAIIVCIYIVVFVIFFYLAGSIITTFHPDGGAIIYVSIFWALPLILCVLSTREFNFIKRNENGLIKLKRKNADKSLRKLFFVIAWLFIIGLLFMIASVYGFMFNDVILKRIFSNYGDEISKYFSYNDVYILLITIEIIHLVLALLNFICGIGLIFKNKSIWKFTVYYHLVFSWTLIGLVIACVLNEKSIKEIITQ